MSAETGTESDEMRAILHIDEGIHEILQRLTSLEQKAEKWEALAERFPIIGKFRDLGKGRR